MVKDGRKKGNETKLRYKAEAQIIAKEGMIGPTEMVKKLAEHGFKVSRQTVTEDLKKDLKAVSSEEIHNYKSQILKNLSEGSQTMYNLSQNSDDPDIKIKAWNAYNRGVKVQADVVAKFEEVKMKLKDVERPVINVYFGQPIAVDEKKVEQHEHAAKNTYDPGPNPKPQNPKEKKIDFKAGDGQDTLDMEEEK